MSINSPHSSWLDTATIWLLCWHIQYWLSTYEGKSKGPWEFNGKNTRFEGEVKRTIRVQTACICRGVGKEDNDAQKSYDIFGHAHTQQRLYWGEKRRHASVITRGVWAGRQQKELSNVMNSHSIFSLFGKKPMYYYSSRVSALQLYYTTTLWPTSTAFAKEIHLAIHFARWFLILFHADGRLFTL